MCGGSFSSAHTSTITDIYRLAQQETHIAIKQLNSDLCGWYAEINVHVSYPVICNFENDTFIPIKSFYFILTFAEVLKDFTFIWLPGWISALYCTILFVVGVSG